MSAISLVALISCNAPMVVSSKIEFRVCAENTTIVTKKSVCYVRDIKTKQNQFEFVVCAGINVSGGTAVFGGSASAGMCATVTVSAESEEQARKLVEKHLSEKVTPSALEKAGIGGNVKRVESPKVVPPMTRAERAEAKELFNTIDQLDFSILPPGF